MSKGLCETPVGCVFVTIKGHMLAAALSLAVLTGGCAQAPVTTVTPSASPSATPTLTLTPTPTSTPTPTPTPTPAAVLNCKTPPSTFVSQAPGSGKTVALTFDDGPAPADPAILDVLAQHKVKATFFLTGQHAQALPDVVKRMAREGHVVADHSWDHKYPSAVPGGWTSAHVTDQSKRTNALLTQLTGRPICFHRPPGGYKDGVLAATSKLGLTSVMWSVDSMDWQQPGSTTAAATADIVARSTEAGKQQHPIVLMHSGKASHEPDSKTSPNRSNTVAALPKIIEWYKANGYVFVTMDGRSA